MDEDEPGGVDRMPDDREYFDAYHRIPGYRLVYPDENVVRFLAANYPSDQRANQHILDLGCGLGRHLVLLGELGFQAVGIDGSPVAVSGARDWLRRRGLAGPVDEGRIDKLPYEDASFDGILEHATLVNNDWETILEACSEAHRVLKPGALGWFLLKRREDCAFDRATQVAANTFLVEESVYISRRSRLEPVAITFRAFSRDDISQMFAPFRRLNVHTWDTSFKGLGIDEVPGERLTAYWIVVVQK